MVSIIWEYKKEKSLENLMVRNAGPFFPTASEGVGTSWRGGGG